MSAKHAGTRTLGRIRVIEQPDVAEPAQTETENAWASPLLLVLLCWLMATGRWGSYVGAPGAWLFATDIVLAGVALALIVSHRVTWARCRAAARHPLMVVVLALLALSLVRLLCEFRLDKDALRDFAPFGYAVVALMAVASRSWLRLRTWHIAAVIVVHAAWVYWAPAMLRNWDLPMLGPIHMFDIRNDFDAAVCGIAATFCLIRSLETRVWVMRIGWLMLAIFDVYLILQLRNRAAVIATVVSVVAALVAYAPHVRRSAVWRDWRKRALVLAGIAVALATLVPYAASTSTGTKMVNSISGAQGANGTLQARQEVYGIVWRYVTHSPSRLIVGVGFGPDFLHTTGAAKIYEGTEYTGVRSPHNAVLGTLARLGVVGALLQLLLIIGGAVLAIDTLRRRCQPSLLFAALIVLSLPVVALFGVILESPFGAIPYFWAIGSLVAARLPEGDPDPLLE